MNVNQKDIIDMREFLNQVEIIKNDDSYPFISLFSIKNKINDLIQQYQLKNSIFNLLKCVISQNQVELVLNTEHIRTKYVYTVINTVYNSNHLLKIL